MRVCNDYTHYSYLQAIVYFRCHLLQIPLIWMACEYFKENNKLCKEFKLIICIRHNLFKIKCKIKKVKIFCTLVCSLRFSNFTTDLFLEVFYFILISGSKKAQSSCRMLFTRNKSDKRPHGAVVCIIYNISSHVSDIQTRPGANVVEYLWYELM